VETLPAIAAAAVGGAVCALALVPLVGPAVDLAAFTGVPVAVPLHANLIAIVATAAGRVQLPRDMTDALGMRDRVRLQQDPDHIAVWPDRAASRPGAPPAGGQDASRD
jgi:hypothetical protein